MMNADGWIIFQGASAPCWEPVEIGYYEAEPAKLPLPPQPFNQQTKALEIWQ